VYNARAYFPSGNSPVGCGKYYKQKGQKEKEYLAGMPTALPICCM